MEETGILENPNLTSACYLALNQANICVSLCVIKSGYWGYLHAARHRTHNT